ncbi:MAG TPA: QueT transporter family protein [Clostridiaceae bacterium]|nr:QueT transporter family protein [Clostridiaceae bacterium]
MWKRRNIRFLAEAAIIAALYAVISIIFAPISSGMFQMRISEALTILPAFTPAAIPGLFVGCVVTNIVSGNGPIDVIFGSLATLVAAFLSYKMPRRFLVPLPPVLINAVVVGFILNYVLQAPLLASMGWVALGQAAACYGLGYPLMLQLGKYKDKIFPTCRR